MNNHQKGYHRDKQIIALVEKLKCVNTEQIHLMFFSGVSMRVTQRRLAKLVAQKRLRRVRISIDQPYCYYTGKKPGQIDHALGVSWAYVWLATCQPNWLRLHSFQTEYTCANLRADGFVVFKNVATNELLPVFVEYHDCDSGNVFDKPQKYNTLYSTEAYLGEWWASKVKRFPRILVVTTDKKDQLKKEVAKNNKAGLEFVVKTLEEIVEECKRRGNYAKC